MGVSLSHEGSNEAIPGWTRVDPAVASDPGRGIPRRRRRNGWSQRDPVE
jgi:hypothetical protein